MALESITISRKGENHVNQEAQIATMRSENEPAPEELGDCLPRVTALENMLTLLERRVDELHEVLIDQGRRFDQMERHVKQSADDLTKLRDAQSERRDPQQERPPHY